jgi:hypothetical protein
MTDDQTSNRRNALTKTTRDKLENEVGKAMRDAMKSIPDLIQSRLDSIVAQAFGFKNDGWNHRWEVDHCNGRTSKLGNMISDNVASKVRTKINALLDTAGIKITKEQERSIIREAKKEYTSVLRRELLHQVEEMAKHEAHKLACELVPKLSEINMDVKAIFDPDFGKTERERIRIEMHLEEHENPKED